MAVKGSDCLTGKRQFATRQEAVKAARAGRARGWFTDPYRCWHCRCWHIGNRRGAGRAERGR